MSKWRKITAEMYLNGTDAVGYDGWDEAQIELDSGGRREVWDVGRDGDFIAIQTARDEPYLVTDYHPIFVR